MAFDSQKANQDLQSTVSVFNDPDANAETVAAAGEAFLHTLYGGRKNDELNTCRFFAYKGIVARQPNHSKFNMAILPPTCNSAKQHSFRVYHQVQEWHGNNLPQSTGAGNWYKAISLKEPAPSHLLQLI